MVRNIAHVVPHPPSPMYARLYHCAAAHVTLAFSLALKDGNGFANSTPNHHSSPMVPLGDPGGQSGKRDCNVRRLLAAAAITLGAWWCSCLTIAIKPE